MTVSVELESCRTCGEGVEEPNWYNRSGVPVCDDCHDDRWSYCSRCECSVLSDNYNFTWDMCNRCAESLGECRDCGNVCDIDYMYSSDHDGNLRCDYCHESHIADMECIDGVSGYHEGAYWGLVFHSGHYVSDTQELRTYFGVELESENIGSWVSDILHELANDRIGHAEQDGSLNSGIEFITQPATLSAWRGSFGERIREYMQAVKANGGSFNANTCGAHVHVSRTAFDDDNHLARFAVFMTHNPEFALAISGRNSLHQWARTDKHVRGELRRNVKNKTGNRYSAVNLSNPNTVEIRIFRGTNDFAEIIGAIEFINALIEYTRDINASDVIAGALLADTFIIWLNELTGASYLMARELVARRYGIPE